MNPSEPKKKQSSNVLLKLLLVLFVLVFAVSTTVLVKTLWEAKQQKDQYDQLAQLAGTAPAAPAPPEAEPTPEPTKEERFAALAQLNPNFVGWLQVPGTAINYPVVFTPDEPEYYLRRGYDGKHAEGGTLFLGEGCTFTGSSAVIHGHNMDNGTMFADVMEYRDKTYWQEHPGLEFDTFEGDFHYDIMGAFYIDAADPEEFPLYAYVGDLAPEQFAQLADFICRRRLYDTGVNAQWGDKILLLSTCSYHTKEGRLVLAARCLADPNT